MFPSQKIYEGVRIRIKTLVLYIIFGFFHELSHLMIASWIGVWSPSNNADERLARTLLLALLGRACRIPVAADDEYSERIVRHAGWMASLLLALLVQYNFRKWSDETKSLSNYNKQSLLCCARTAAWITAFEAAVTDLMGFGGFDGNNHNNNYFLCGNFGIILTNAEAWVDYDKGRTALDLLERMVHVTMMRGAQTGGVVAWTSNRNHENIRGIRSRVVNGKRTDLSKGIRQQVERDCTTTMPCNRLKTGIRAFLGHTRFATSSKATFDGTHPHRWTPPKKLWVYKLDQRKVYSSSNPKPQRIRVENYVTHNGDFDFYTLNGTPYGLEVVQQWLTKATGAKMPAPVDSAAIAGMMDLLRTAGCFGLSARYALLLNCKSSKMDPNAELPSYKEFEEMGHVFEKALQTTCQKTKVSLNVLKKSQALRKVFCRTVLAVLNTRFFVEKKTMVLASMIAHDEESTQDKVSLYEVVKGTIDAFFDNDLFVATRIFMHNAKGSFGIMVTSSLDAHRQVCLAARGQPMCVAFYPKKGLVCYGSEQAAVKVGLDVAMPGGDTMGKDSLAYSRRGPHSNKGTEDIRKNESIAEETCRLDLDDLGGEVMLLDWGRSTEEDRMIEDVDRTRHQMLRGSTVDIMVFRESKTTSALLPKRIVPLEDNRLIQELPTDSDDPVLDDIRDIPRVCKSIQDSWEEAGLNRYTAWNLVRRIKQRLNARLDGKIPSNIGAVDILLTGCEVSLWVAEQFATDLHKAFPNLNVQAISSNKLLGVFGQDLTMPATGSSISEKTYDLNQAIVIIVSHSGQTFAPLACSSLLQSFTRDIFVVSSEWDTQIGKQLRGMYKDDEDFFTSRIFTTEVGVRPAEPCSVSVVATQQLLTQIFMHVSIALLSDAKLRHFCGAVITQTDLQELARCNRDCLVALENIVGTSRFGRRMKVGTGTEKELRRAGDVWSEHILEYPKAYFITLIYILGTVTSGYAPITSVAIAAGVEDLNDSLVFIARFFDAVLYFFFLQVTIFTLRLLQGRNMRHRTVGRTVVIGDIPWVSQSADAFLSKLFACSYPIAGINVLSGNPADHLVHRHTHRVVRGTLLICGRPDGRLAALTNTEVSVCLSINQSSSIQSIRGSCETVTIGHNPSKLSLSSNDICLGDYRPQYLCERVMGDMDEEEERKKMHENCFEYHNSDGFGGSSGSMRIRGRHIDTRSSAQSVSTIHGSSDESTQWRGSSWQPELRETASRARSLDDSWGRSNSISRRGMKATGVSTSFLDDSGRSKRRGSRLFDKGQNKSSKSLDESGRRKEARSTQSIKGLYLSLKQLSEDDSSNPDDQMEQKVIEEMIKERKGMDIMQRLFKEMDVYGTGHITVETFVSSYAGANSGGLTEDQVRQVMVEADVGQEGMLDFDDFCRISKMPAVEILRNLQLAPRDYKGYLHVHPSDEEYFGEELQQSAESNVGAFAMSQSQHFSMELYESRIASLQRFVAMCVMFHQMGSRVERFFRRLSLGILGYRMDRTHSILRIATTASPVSAADVRERMVAIAQRARILNAIRMVSTAWFRVEQARVKQIKAGIRRRNSFGEILDHSGGSQRLDRSNSSQRLDWSVGSQRSRGAIVAVEEDAVFIP